MSKKCELIIIICDGVMQNIIDNFEEVSKEEPTMEEPPNDERPEEYTAVSYAEELHC